MVKNLFVVEKYLEETIAGKFTEPTVVIKKELKFINHAGNQIPFKIYGSGISTVQQSLLGNCYKIIFIVSSFTREGSNSCPLS